MTEEQTLDAVTAALTGDRFVVRSVGIDQAVVVDTKSGRTLEEINGATRLLPVFQASELARIYNRIAQVGKGRRQGPGRD